MQKLFVLVGLISFAHVCSGAELKVPADYATIQAGINAAGAGDTVLVADGTYTGTDNKNLDPGGVDILIQSENGPDNCVIDCEYSGRGFYIHSGENAGMGVVGFTIINGVAPALPVGAYGGAIFLDGPVSPSIKNCLIQGCSAERGGGVMFRNFTGLPSMPDLRGCQVEACSADHGAGIRCEENVTANIADCTFYLNRALVSGSNGGGISCYLASGTQFNYCDIIDNASYKGSGIHLLKSDVVFKHCNVHDNQPLLVGAVGGGIYIDQSAPDFYYCRIYQNSVDLSGGGVYIAVDSQPTFQLSSIFSNSAGENGGGVYLAGNDAMDKLTLFDIMLNDNRANLGTGIYVNNATLSYKNCTSQANIPNPPQIYAAVIYVTGPIADATIHDSILWNTGDKEIHVAQGRVNVDFSDVEGGETSVIVDSGATLNWDTSNMNDDPLFCAGELALCYLQPGSPCVNQGQELASVVLLHPPGELQIGFDTLTVHCSGDLDTGLVDLGVHLPPMTHVVNVPEDFSSIQDAVDIVCGDHGVITLADGTYTGPGNRDIDYGGKIITVESENGPDNCVIDCENLGRGFHFHSGEYYDAIVRGITIRNGNKTSGSWEDSSGGGILCWNNTSCTLENCIIEYCKAINGSGIMLSGSCYMVVDGCNIRYNGNTDMGYGGGIRCESGESHILNSIIEGNECGYYGGGISISAVFNNSSIENCTIQYNKSGHFGGGIDNEYSDCVISGCDINSNVSHHGGGIAIFQSSPELYRCTFDNNSVSGNGAGIYFCLDSYAHVYSCEILENEAGRDGGGIYISHSSIPEIANCLIVGNISLEFGGGMYWETEMDEANTIRYCTIALNQAVLGGGVYSVMSKPVFRDSILWNNSPNNILDISGLLQCHCCDIGPDSSIYPGTNNNINADPLFVTGPRGDFYLSQSNNGQPPTPAPTPIPTSPCVDAGDSSSFHSNFIAPGEVLIRLSTLVTQKDDNTDDVVVDLGYHYYPNVKQLKSNRFISQPLFPLTQ